MATQMKQIHSGADFKVMVGLEAIRNESEITEIATRYGIFPKQVSEWRNRLLAGLPEVFSAVTDQTKLKISERAACVRKMLLGFEEYHKAVQKSSQREGNSYWPVGQYGVAMHLFPRNNDDAILDIGCGPGHFLNYLESLGYSNLHGLDFEPQTTLPESEEVDPDSIVPWSEQGRAQISHGDVTDISRIYESARFDVIIALNLFNAKFNSQDIAARDSLVAVVLRAMVSILKPDGLLILSREFNFPEGAAGAAGLRLLKSNGGELRCELYSREEEGNSFLSIQSVLDTAHPALDFLRPIVIGKPVLGRFELKGIYDTGEFVSFVFLDTKNSAPFAYKLCPVGVKDPSPETFALVIHSDGGADQEGIRQLGKVLHELIIRNARAGDADRFAAAFSSLYMLQGSELHPCPACLLGCPPGKEW